MGEMSIRETEQSEHFGDYKLIHGWDYVGKWRRVRVDTDGKLCINLSNWSWDCLKGTEVYNPIAGTWSVGSDTNLYLGKFLRNTSANQNDEVAIPFYASGTTAVTLNIRGITNVPHGIMTLYMDGISQGTIDWYSAAKIRNVIKTINITPIRKGMNVLRIKMATKNGSASAYRMETSEMWLS